MRWTNILMEILCVLFTALIKTFIAVETFIPKSAHHTKRVFVTHVILFTLLTNNTEHIKRVKK